MNNLAQTEAQYAGAVVLQPDLYWRNQASPADIENPQARSIVEAVGEMLREGEEVSVISVAERSRLPISTVGEITQQVYSPIGAASAARQITEAAARRRACGALREAVTAIEEGAEPANAIREAQDRINARREEESVSIAEAVKRYGERVEKPRALVTQLPRLNELLRIDGGKLITIAGRPGTFKSAFALHVARYSALRGMGVGIVSLEMPTWEIADRFVKQGGGRTDDADVPILINDRAQSLAEIETQIIEWVERDGVRGVVVDYLGLVTAPAPRTMRRDEIIGMVTRRLKLLAMRLDVPILMLAQLNRESERHGRRPILSDLRESGNIEQDSDVVIFLHRHEVEGEDEYELILAKHRGGPTGYIDLHIVGAHYRVLEAAR